MAYNISAYLVTMDQAKSMENALIGESDPEERQKIGDRINTLIFQFAALNTFVQTRMTISLSLSSYSNSCRRPVESYKPTIKKPTDL